MSSKKTNCGGIIIDNETIVEEDGVLKAINNNSPDATFVVTIEPVHGGLENPSATFAEIAAASESGKAVFLVTPKTSTAGGAQYVLTDVSSVSGATFERLFYNTTNQTISANIVTCSDANAWSIITKTLTTS